MIGVFNIVIFNLLTIIFIELYYFIKGFFTYVTLLIFSLKITIMKILPEVLIYL
jgi:hypothetical protein